MSDRIVKVTMNHAPESYKYTGQTKIIALSEQGRLFYTFMSDAAPEADHEVEWVELPAPLWDSWRYLQLVEFGLSK